MILNSSLAYLLGHVRKPMEFWVDTEAGSDIMVHVGGIQPPPPHEIVLVEFRLIGKLEDFIQALQCFIAVPANARLLSIFIGKIQSEWEQPSRLCCLGFQLGCLSHTNLSQGEPFQGDLAISLVSSIIPVETLLQNLQAHSPFNSKAPDSVPHSWGQPWQQ